MTKEIIFYTNSMNKFHSTISQLEQIDRIKDILYYLKQNNKLIDVDTRDYENLLTHLPNSDKSYIINILNKIKNTKIQNCIMCSWYNILDNNNNIECEFCSMNITKNEKRYGYFDEKCTDTSIHHNTIFVLENMLSCIDKVFTNNIINDKFSNDVMLVTRPPGHHSSLDIISGFCYLNWVYIISQYLVNKLNNKVCIIDLDLHHGNGTEKMICNKNNSLFIDLHYYDSCFYPKSGNENEYISDNIININMPKNSDDEKYINRLIEQFDTIENFSPDVFIISVGCDIIEGDHFNIMKCSNLFYKKIYDILKDKFNKNIVMVLEGGYNKENITETIKNLL